MRAAIMREKFTEGGQPVKVVIYREPCWLLEAAELVYSLANGIPAENLTTNGPFSIPPEEIVAIQTAACEEIDPKDQQIQFYFSGVQLEGISERMFCPGICILHQGLELAHSEPEEMVEALPEGMRWFQETGFYISGLGPFSAIISKNRPQASQTLVDSIRKLSIPKVDQERLLEVYSSYELHLKTLARLLQPVVEVLKQRLRPWVERAVPRLDQWKTFFQENSAKEFLQNCGRTMVEEYDTLEMTVGYFFPNLSPAITIKRIWTVRCILGIGREPSMQLCAVGSPETWELNALRMVTNPARLEMLCAMRNTPMAVQELAQRLDLNVGSVFRDVNNMRNARLLVVDYSGDRTVYRANVPEIERIAERVLNYLRN